MRNVSMKTRYLRLDRKDISYLAFLLEGYENMITMSTIDKREGIVKLFVPEDFIKDMDAVLCAMGHEIIIIEQDPIYQ